LRRISLELLMKLLRHHSSAMLFPFSVSTKFPLLMALSLSPHKYTLQLSKGSSNFPPKTNSHNTNFTTSTSTRFMQMFYEAHDKFTVREICVNFPINMTV
jgi:hypothetical protein